MTKCALLQFLDPISLLIIMQYVVIVGGARAWASLSKNYICAVRGSSVFMPCSVTPPAGHTVTEVFWVVYHGEQTTQLWDLSKSTSYSGRVEYFWDGNHTHTQRNCTVKISSVKSEDSARYKLRIITDKSKWLSSSFVQLVVTDDLSACTEKDWVTLIHQHICALRGSSVVMPCSFTPPAGQNASNIFWRFQPKDGRKMLDLSSNTYYKDRVEYLWDENNYASNCSMRLTEVKKTDSTRYKVRIETDKYNWLSHSFVQLTVTDLTLEVPETVVEGHEVNLSCTTICTLEDNPTVIWRKNGEDFTGIQTNSFGFLLPRVSTEDEGDYSCALKGHEGHPSKPVKLNVMYLPKNTSTSVSPAGEIVEGSSVTLNCSSDANPPVQNYTWFKRNGTAPSVVGSEKIYRIYNIRSGHANKYYCMAKNQHGASNSTPVYLDVQYAPKTVVALVSPSGEIVEGTSVTLTCSSDANPPVQIYTWFKRNGTAPSVVGSEKIYRIYNIRSEHANKYYCMAKNQHGASNSTPVYLDVQYAPKTVVALVSPSGETVEGTSVTLTCSSDANPPVQNYTWLKRNGTAPSVVGSTKIYRITKITSEDTGYYHCVGKNKYGGSISADVHLNVQYPPKGTSASYDHTGDLGEGVSVTLTCSSDANPPVEHYTWYRRTGDETTAVGSGETITFTLTSTSAGFYQCEAWNRIGSQTSAVGIFLPEAIGWQRTAVFATVGIVPVMMLVLGLVYWRRKIYHVTGTDINPENDVNNKNDDQGGDPGSMQMNSVYQSLDPNTTQPDDLYLSLNPRIMQQDAIYLSLGPNTTQSKAADQSLNPNTTQPEDIYQNLVLQYHPTLEN